MGEIQLAFNNNGGGNSTVPTVREGGNSIGLQNHGGGKFNWPPKSWRGEIQLALNNNDGGNFTVPHSIILTIESKHFSFVFSSKTIA